MITDDKKTRFKPLRAIFFLSLMFCIALISANFVSGAWWNANWVNKKQIQVAGGSGALTDFPVMVRVSYEPTMRADYGDIRFLDYLESSELYYERDFYNSTEAIFWVKMPTLNTTTNIIYMYYGNSLATTTQNLNQTWSNNYIGVFHMNEMKDSRGLSTITDQGLLLQAGLIGNSTTNVSGTSRWQVNNSLINTASDVNITIDVLYNIQGTAGTIIECGASGASFNGWWFGFGDAHNGGKVGQLTYLSKGTATASEIANTSQRYDNIGAYKWASVTNNGAKANIYVNGSLVGWNTGTMPSNTCTNIIGLFNRNTGTSNIPFGGLGDEVFISNVSRSTSWISRTHQITNTSTVIFGSESLNNVFYNSTTIVGAQESFILNYTITPPTELISANLIYNNTLYPSSIFSSGTSRVIINTLEIPSITSNASVPFYWQLFLTSGEQNTSVNYQFVNVVGLDNCSLYPYRLLNISLYDEQKRTSMRGDLEIIYEVLSSNNIPLNYFSTKITNVSNTLICSAINLSGIGRKYSAQIKYYAPEYVSEFYNIQRAQIPLQIQPLELFLLNSSHSTEFKITYQDNSYNYVDNAIVQLQRKYFSDNIYKIVEAPLTSNEGVALIHVDLDTNQYQITITKNGQVLDLFDNIVFKCDNILTGECNQKLLGSVNPQNDISLESILDFEYSTPSVLGTKVMTSFSVPSGSPAIVNLKMVQRDMFGNITLCNQTIVSSAGAIECEFIETIGDSYLDVSLYKNGEIIAFNTYIIPESGGLDWFGNNYIIALIILLSLFGMAFSSPEWIVMNGIMTMVIAGALWLLRGLDLVVGLGALVWLLIAGAILIFKLAKQEDR